MPTKPGALRRCAIQVWELRYYWLIPLVLLLLLFFLLVYLARIEGHSRLYPLG